MQINLPKTDQVDVFSVGLDKWLYRRREEIQSPLVYNTVDERLSQLVQTEGKAATILNGLPISEV